jgi:hypothetical protein
VALISCVSVLILSIPVIHDTLMHGLLYNILWCREQSEWVLLVKINHDQHLSGITVNLALSCD